jgi:hypothetical protein
MLECMLQKGRRPELRGRTSRVWEFCGYVHNNTMRNLTEGRSHVAGFQDFGTPGMVQTWIGRMKGRRPGDREGVGNIPCNHLSNSHVIAKG